MKTLASAALLSSLMIAGANAQGLLGERYAEIGGGYERISGFGESLDGWGFGAGVNVPLNIQDHRFGLDFNGGAGYWRASDSGLTFKGTGVVGSFRGYMPLENAITPFAEVGLGWSRAEVSGFGFSESDSTFTLPLGVGAEFQVDAFSLTPFFNYTVALESDYDNTWTIGATGAYWFPNN